MKTVCLKRHMGSNPILSGSTVCGAEGMKREERIAPLMHKFIFVFRDSLLLEDYPSGEGAPLLRE